MSIHIHNKPGIHWAHTNDNTHIPRRTNCIHTLGNSHSQARTGQYMTRQHNTTNNAPTHTCNHPYWDTQTQKTTQSIIHAHKHIHAGAYCNLQNHTLINTHTRKHNIRHNSATNTGQTRTGQGRAIQGRGGQDRTEQDIHTYRQTYIHPGR